MGARASYYFGFASFLAALSFFLLLMRNLIYHVPLYSVLIAVFSGLVVGTVSGAAVSLRQLHILAAKGETRVSLVTWLFIIGAFFITIGALLFVVGESFETLRIISNFVYPLVPANIAVKALLFYNWEQKHKRVILFANAISSKLYVFPRIDDSAVQ